MLYEICSGTSKERRLYESCSDKIKEGAGYIKFLETRLNKEQVI
jgi:hypothetical protein